MGIKKPMSRPYKCICGKDFAMLHALTKHKLFCKMLRKINE